jgi:thiamine pyrophosphokinase
MTSKTVIVADGSFPVHEIPLGYLKSASRIVCCDGSTFNLLKAGYEPDAIVGDMDSISRDLAERFSDRLFPSEEQETNDLTKAVSWCHENGYNEVVIVGATGKREDHTLGNISLLTEYKEMLDVIMVTDNGTLTPYSGSCMIRSFPGQQISLFSINPETRISSSGLKYKLLHTVMKNWWVATLNEATGDKIELDFTGGPVIVFQKFRE